MRRGYFWRRAGPTSLGKERNGNCPEAAAEERSKGLTGALVTKIAAMQIESVNRIPRC